MKYFIITILATFTTISSTFAQKVLQLNDSKESVAIGKSIAYFEDKEKVLNIKDIETPEIQKQFIQFNKDVPSFGFINSNFWIKIQIENQHSSYEDWYLDIDFPVLDSVEVYYLQGKEWKKHVLGDKVPLEAKKIPFRSLIAPVHLPMGKVTTLYIKVQTDGSVLMPAYIHSAPQLIKSIGISELLFGMMYGSLLIMLFYNLFLYFSLRNKSYLYYCLYFLGYLAVMPDGYTYAFIFKEPSWLSQMIIPYGLALSMIAALLFAMHFLQTKKYTPILHKVLMGFLILSGVIFLAIGFISYNAAAAYTTLLLMVDSFVLWISGLIAWRSGNKAAKLYVAAWTAVLIGLISVSLLVAGAIPFSSLARRANYIGIVIQMVFLSLALADRINILRKEREQAQAAALASAQENERIIKEQNTLLEEKVDERTHELQQKQEEILVQNEELHQQQEEITAQRDFIERKNRELNQLNEHMSMSIQYASKIQNASHPSSEQLQKSFSDLFVINLPRDVVSGDFYWHTRRLQYEYLAVVDCTGHGVPGAFMSMIGSTLLNEIINISKIEEPSAILETLHERVKNVLKQSDTGNTDGMDVCLCRIKKQDFGYELVFAGAKRSLYVIDYKGNWKELKGDRKSIGGTQLNGSTSFSDQRLELHKSDRLYMFTDGITDIPNPERKKFGLESLKTILVESGKADMRSQQHLVLSEIAKFQRDAVQRDDVLIMGIEI
ncbi:MAG: 7TM diverse intracellular signaling domain-containing protein [Thermonemataceae bacterium]